jgi:hypothetical protein
MRQPPQVGDKLGDDQDQVCTCGEFNRADAFGV